MFWSIFFNSVVLIVAIMVIGWAVARFIESPAKQGASNNSEGE